MCRYLKGVNSRSLTVRNLQLSLYGLPFSIMYMLAKDGRSRPAGGLMIGFNAVAWAVVGLQVVCVLQDLSRQPRSWVHSIDCWPARLSTMCALLRRSSAA